MASPIGNKKVGPTIAILLIVLVLIIAALYIFAARMNQPAIPTDNSVPAAAAANTNDVSSLSNDLNASTNGLDNQNF